MADRPSITFSDYLDGGVPEGAPLWRDAAVPRMGTVRTIGRNRTDGAPSATGAAGAEGAAGADGEGAAARGNPGHAS